MAPPLWAVLLTLLGALATLLQLLKRGGGRGESSSGSAPKEAVSAGGGVCYLGSVKSTTQPVPDGPTVGETPESLGFTLRESQSLSCKMFMFMRLSCCSRAVRNDQARRLCYCMPCCALTP
jgi:hypothetical protein